MLHLRLPPRVPGARARHRLAAGAMIGAFALIAVGSLAPPPRPSFADDAALQASDPVSAQRLTVSQSARAVSIARDGYSATAGVQSLAAGGTNYDWAKLVLLDAGLPTTDSNVTVLTRWMRQENGADDWWNRNNPLNNGWGSGGNSGLGNYDSLELAAENAAAALHNVPGYSGIVQALAVSAPTAAIESAIWASPWASSHYANGGHWAYTTVQVVTAPEGAWAR